MLLVCELRLMQAAGLGASQASQMSGKQRLKSERIVRSYRWDARSRSESARGAALPKRAKAHSIEARRRAPLAPAAEAEQAESIVSEREAAAKFNALRPGLSMGCPKPVEACQGCSASEESQGAFDCGSSASSI